LRIGAGAKGKIASSLACGVPCVTTTIGAEGMDLSGERIVFVADDPASFAECVRCAYADASTWQRMSQAGLQYAYRTLSVASFRQGLAQILADVGVEAHDRAGQAHGAIAAATPT
jgi:glycosyltransferase involved in cell wall biosynthesis